MKTQKSIDIHSVNANPKVKNPQLEFRNIIERDIQNQLLGDSMQEDLDWFAARPQVTYRFRRPRSIELEYMVDANAPGEVRKIFVAKTSESDGLYYRLIY